MERFQYSPWAEASLKTFLSWETIPVREDDLRQPISRGAFAEMAAAFVAMSWGSNLDSYLLITACRNPAGDTGRTRLDVGLDLGILQGKADGDLCLGDTITRQEAAVMLARTYQLYHTVPEEELPALPFRDQGSIAPWAREDVQLMASLGVLKGKTEDRFDPQGQFTKEQYLATLVRLAEITPDTGELNNPFALSFNPGFFQVWDSSNQSYAFVLETEDLFLWAREIPQNIVTIIGSRHYCIQIVDRDFSLRTYPTPILESASYRGEIHATPENPVLSPDGKTLYYTATLTRDAYHNYYDEDGNWVEELIFLKGVYTVTMDLASGTQTYTRADLPENT